MGSPVASASALASADMQPACTTGLVPPAETQPVRVTCDVPGPSGQTQHMTLGGERSTGPAAPDTPGSGSTTGYVDNFQGTWDVDDMVTFYWDGARVIEQSFSEHASGPVSVYWKGCSPTESTTGPIGCGSNYFFYDPESGYWFCQKQRIYAYRTGYWEALIYSLYKAPDPRNGASCIGT